MPRITLAFIWLILPTALTLGYVSTLVQYPLDFWHHLTTGRAIWQCGAIPVRDTFTFTIDGQPITNQCWLAQLTMYGLFCWGGFALAQFVAAICYAAAIAVTTATAWQRSRNARIAAAMALGCMVVALSNFGVRPQAFSFLLFAVELLVLWCWPARRTTWAIIAVVEVLWTNTHGAFPLGVVLPALFLTGTAWTVWRVEGIRSAWLNPIVRGYASCLLIAATGAFCNPHPGRTLDYVVGVGTTAPVRGIGEWAPSRLDSYTGIAFVVSAVVIAAILAMRWRRVTASELILLAPFAALALQHQRMVAWWSMVATTVIAHHLVELLRAWIERPTGRDPSENTREKGAFFNWVPLALLLAWLGMSTPWTRSYNPLLAPSKRESRAVDDPQPVVEYLGRVGCHGHIYCPMEWGAYLTWHLGPQARVFIDGRIDFFPASVWRDYLLVGHADPGWEEVLSRDDITWVIWSKELSSRLPSILIQTPLWEKVYEDDLAWVLARRGVAQPKPKSAREFLPKYRHQLSLRPLQNQGSTIQSAPYRGEQVKPKDRLQRLSGGADDLSATSRSIVFRRPGVA